MQSAWELCPAPCCDRPNRITVDLPGFEVGTDTVVVDLAELVAGIDLADGIPGDCSSGPADASCNAPFSAFGIEFGSGEVSGEQRVFKRRAGR